MHCIFLHETRWNTQMSTCRISMMSVYRVLIRPVGGGCSRDCYCELCSDLRRQGLVVLWIKDAQYDI